MLKLAEHIIDTKTADFDPLMLEDHYRNALAETLRQKATATAAPCGPSQGFCRERGHPHGGAPAQHQSRAAKETAYYQPLKAAAGKKTLFVNSQLRTVHREAIVTSLSGRPAEL
jgi:hypothetical protein